MPTAADKRERALSRGYRQNARTRYMVRALVAGISYIVTRTQPLGHVHHVSAKSCDDAMTQVLKKDHH